MEKAIIFDVARGSFVDGPGVRTTVFFKGCNLKCLWCHNPEGQSAVRELLFYENKCCDCGICKAVCPSKTENCILCGECTFSCPTGARLLCGKSYTPDEIFSEIEKDKVYYESSGGGVTFSGGECMLQIDFLLEILKKCKENGIHTAIDTAGHVPFEEFKRILPYTDLFLYDIKLYDSEKHKKYTGVGNGLILDNLKRLFEADARIWIRIPIIPSVNGSVEDMKKIKAFLDSCGSPERIQLLPYHKMGESKDRALGRPWSTFEVPNAQKIKFLEAIFK